MSLSTFGNSKWNIYIYVFICCKNCVFKLAITHKLIFICVFFFKRNFLFYSSYVCDVINLELSPTNQHLNCWRTDWGKFEFSITSAYQWKVNTLSDAASDIFEWLFYSIKFVLFFRFFFDIIKYDVKFLFMLSCFFFYFSL